MAKLATVRHRRFLFDLEAQVLKERQKHLIGISGLLILNLMITSLILWIGFR